MSLCLSLCLSVSLSLYVSLYPTLALYVPLYPPVSRSVSFCVSLSLYLSRDSALKAVRLPIRLPASLHFKVLRLRHLATGCCSDDLYIHRKLHANRNLLFLARLETATAAKAPGRRRHHLPLSCLSFPSVCLLFLSLCLSILLSLHVSLSVSLCLFGISSPFWVSLSSADRSRVVLLERALPCLLLSPQADVSCLSPRRETPVSLVSPSSCLCTRLLWGSIDPPHSRGLA